MKFAPLMMSSVWTIKLPRFAQREHYDPARDPFLYARGGRRPQEPSYSFAAVQDFSA